MGPKYIPCHTIAHEKKKQEQEEQEQQNNNSCLLSSSNDNTIQKFHKNTIISLFPKSITYYNQIMAEKKDPSELCAASSNSITTILSRGNASHRMKNAYTLHVQPKLRTCMYTKQIPRKSYNNNNVTTTENNNSCLACKGRFVMHTCTSNNKYIPTTPEIEKQKAELLQKKNLHNNKKPIKVLTIEEMEEKRRIKIEKRRIYDSKRRERKRAEKLALLKKQQVREGLAN